MLLRLRAIEGTLLPASHERRSGINSFTGLVMIAVGAIVSIAILVIVVLTASSIYDVHWPWKKKK